MVRHIISVIFIISFCVDLLAQSNGAEQCDSIIVTNDATVSKMSDKSEISEYESAIRTNIKLKDRKQKLIDSIKVQNKIISRLESTHASLTNTIKKKQTKLNQSETTKDYLKYKELISNKMALSDSISLLASQIAQNDSLLKVYNQEYSQVKTAQTDLLDARLDVIEKIMVQNAPYISRPYSAISITHLDSIRQACSIYSADSEIARFIKKIDQTKSNKIAFDEVIVTLNSQYNKLNVIKAISKATAIDPTSDTQENELRTVCYQLNAYEDGLLAFKEFITELNKVREGVVKYKIEFYNDDKAHILNTNNLGTRIEKHLMQVPYLSKKYAEFMKLFIANPNKHNSIEDEIMQQ